MTISHVIFVDDYQPFQIIMTADYHGRDEETVGLRFQAILSISRRRGPESLK